MKATAALRKLRTLCRTPGSSNCPHQHNQSHKDYIFSQWTISELMMPCGNMFLLESGQKYPSQHNQAYKETVSFVAVNLFLAG